MKIVFMGTPDFAVSSLDMLVQNDIEIAAVITATDKPAGRGKKMMQSAVKRYAIDKNLPILQPKNLKSRKFLRTLKALEADLFFVVAFRMLPAAVFEMPPLGCVNLHASLLPQYRGAAPINWAVINGETQTGCTTFFIEQKIDTGKIIFQEACDILPNETAGEIHDKLMKMGANLVVKTAKALESGDFPQIEQSKSNDLRTAPKIFKETCEINFQQTTKQVFDFVRGMSPYPAAFTDLEGKKLKIFRAEKIEVQHKHEIGSFHSDGKKYLHFATKDGYIAVTELQLQGRKRMKIDAFLRGYKFK
ncbi:MAG: methionyl-tRNA formyltransferase [Chitinophagales bacterium]